MTSSIRATLIQNIKMAIILSKCGMCQIVDTEWATLVIDIGWAITSSKFATLIVDTDNKFYNSNTSNRHRMGIILSKCGILIVDTGWAVNFTKANVLVRNNYLKICYIDSRHAVVNNLCCPIGNFSPLC